MCRRTFAGYADGDVGPAGEVLTVGKSLVARLVYITDHEELYFDGDIRLPGVDATNPSRLCTLIESPAGKPAAR